MKNTVSRDRVSEPDLDMTGVGIVMDMLRNV
jgi:hypothetical protein